MKYTFPIQIMRLFTLFQFVINTKITFFQDMKRMFSMIYSVYRNTSSLVTCRLVRCVPKHVDIRYSGEMPRLKNCIFIWQ